MGRWLACGLDRWASPGLIGARLATVCRSAWFRWFAWVETGHKFLTDGGATFCFRPEHRAPVELTLQLDGRQRVRGMQLAIAAAFLADRNRPFALDALKSALAALAQGRGAPDAIGSLVAHLEAAMGAPVLPPKPSAEVSAALAVVAGRTTHWRAEGRRLAVSLEWDDETLRLSALPVED